jgi:hypothetical protein
MESGSRIGEKVTARILRETRRRLVPLQQVMAGQAMAEELQKTVVSPAALAALHPAHAVYVYAQNQTSVMSEQLTALDEMAPFVKILSRAEDLYMPGGPPMSPLSTSYFTCWAFFDACIEATGETIGAVILETGARFGMNADLLRVIRLMQESRMGIYTVDAMEGGSAVLRELITGAVCRAIVPSGYHGERGELWYARVLPPAIPGGAEHVVFTSPYVLLSPGLAGWQAYFDRTLPQGPARADSYARHMKYGPTRAYWNDFVFEAYVNYRTEAVYLAGLPDIPESRPHSKVNSWVFP